MPPVHHLGHVAVAVRRSLVRHPWIHWVVVAAAAFGACTSASHHAASIDEARSAWGDTTLVWLATVDHEPGDLIRAEPVEWPAAMVTSPVVSAADESRLMARQRIATGSVIHAVDVTSRSGPTALTPDGWLAVPVLEQPPSGAVVGDRVQLAVDGLLMAADGIVVGHHDRSTLVAVPAADAPGLSLAVRGVQVLLEP